MTSEEQKAFHEGISAAVQAGVADALEEHRRAGRKIPIWRDDKVVWLSVDEAKKATGGTKAAAPGA